MVPPSFYGAPFFMMTLSIILISSSVILMTPSGVLITPSVILSEAKNLVCYGKQKGPWESEEKSRFFASPFKALRGSGEPQGKLRMTGERDQNGHNGQNNKK